MSEPIYGVVTPGTTVLEPVAAPGPPLASDLVPGDVAELLQRTLDTLVAEARATKRQQAVTGYSQDNLDAETGAATFVIYTVTDGMLFELTRLVVECATFDVTNPRTPASPYSHADFWLGIFAVENVNAVGQGAMVDFLPTADGAQGIPAVADYHERAGVKVRGGQSLVAYVVAGTAGQRMTIRYEGWLSQE